MTTSNDPDQIRADIERTRAELSYNVDSLTDTANPKNIADRQVDKVKGAVAGVRDKIMGSPDDPYDDGRVGDVKDAPVRHGLAPDKASAIGNAVSDAPRHGQGEDPRQSAGGRSDRLRGGAVDLVADPVFAEGAGSRLGAAGESGAAEAAGGGCGQGDG